MSIDGFASTSDDDYYTTFVTARYCVSESYTTICRDGISDEEADIICQGEGYTGK